jgi:hypothetical protein
VVLLKLSSDAGTVASFGRSAGDGGRLGRDVASALEQAGYQVVSAAPARVPTGAPPADLPLDDAAARDIARQLGASVAVVLGASAHSDGRIRGTSLRGQEVRLHGKALDANSAQLLWEGTGSAAGYGVDEESAALQAVQDAWASGGRGLAATLARQNAVVASSPARGPQVVVRGFDSWRPVAAILGSLGRRKDIEALNLVLSQRDQVTLEAVGSLSPQRLVSTLRRVELSSALLSVSARGGVVTVEVHPRTSVGMPNG